MSYPDRLTRQLWDSQYWNYCHHHEYQSRRQDPQAGSPLPSASGGTEPARSGRRRTQPAAESVPPDPRACQPPFPAELGPSLSHLALSPIPPRARAPPRRSLSPAAVTPMPEQPTSSPQAASRAGGTGDGRDPEAGAVAQGGIWRRPKRKQAPLPKAG